jgi:phosphoglycolate phosphatase
MTHQSKIGPIHAVLFDKDGTLVDFQRTWGPAVQAVLQHLGSGDRAAYERLLAASRFVDAGQRFLPDSPLIAQPTSVFGGYWATALGRPANADFLAEIDRLLREATTRHLVPIGNPKALLGLLASRGYRLGMISNDAEATARAHAHTLGVDEYLEFIAGYDSGFGAKPDAGPVIAFARAVGVPAPETAVVGDTVVDLAAARAAGAIAVGVMTGPAPSADLASLADVLLASPDELVTWLDCH